MHMMGGGPHKSCVARCNEGYHFRYGWKRMCDPDTAEYLTINCMFLCWSLVTLTIYVLSLSGATTALSKALWDKLGLLSFSFRCPRPHCRIIPLGVDCAICLAKLEKEDVVRTLPCPAAGARGHSFHASCIDTWLTTS